MLGEGDGVVALRHVDDAAGPGRRHRVQRRIDHPQRVSRHLVGQTHDPGEQRCRLARATGREPADLTREALVDVDRPVAGSAHRDVGHAPLGPHHLLDAVLEGRTGEDHREAAPTGQWTRSALPGDELLGGRIVGVVPHRIPRGPVPGGRQVQLRGPHARHQWIAVRPGRHRDVVVGMAVVLHVGSAAVPRGGQDGDPLGRRVDVGRTQSEEGRRRGEALLRGTEALADDTTEVVVDDVGLGGHDLRKAARALVLVGRRLDEEDGGPRGHRVGVLDVEVRLARPSLPVAVLDVGRHRARRLDDGQ